MGKFCVMRTCKHANNKTSSIKRHKFPSSEELRKKWDQFVVEGNHNNQFKSQVSDNIQLCERHFDPSCYTTDGKLKNDAIPTIADKYTPETAIKYNLISSLASESLVNVNEFSKSIITCARTPEQGENTEPTSELVPMEVADELVPENIFSSGMLELMVIDLGEESDDDTASVDNAFNDNGSIMAAPSLKEVKEEEESQPEKSEDSDSDLASPSFSRVTDHDTSRSSAAPASPSSPLRTRLRRRTSTANQAKVDKVDLPSTPVKSSKPTPAKKSTSVNTNSGFDTSLSSASAPRLRSRYSIQLTVCKENSSSTPINSSKSQPAKTKSQPAKTKSQPAKTKPQPAKTISAVNRDSGRRSVRLRSKTSIQAKLDKDDEPSVLVTRLRAPTSIQTEADKVDSCLILEKSREQRQNESPSPTGTAESPATRLRSRSSIKVETSTTPLTRGKRSSLAKNKPEEKSLSRDDQVSSRENKTPFLKNRLALERPSPSANGQIRQLEANLSVSGNNLPVFKSNLVLPEGLPLPVPLVLANGNFVPSLRSCNCSTEDHNKITGIATIPKDAGKEFTKRSEELTAIRRELRNVRQKYECATMKIETLTNVLNHLKEKRRQKSHQAPALYCCLHCKKVLN